MSLSNFGKFPTFISSALFQLHSLSPLLAGLPRLELDLLVSKRDMLIFFSLSIFLLLFILGCFYFSVFQFTDSLFCLLYYSVESIYRDLYFNCCPFQFKTFHSVLLCIFCSLFLIATGRGVGVPDPTLVSTDNEVGVGWVVASLPAAGGVLLQLGLS